MITPVFVHDYPTAIKPLAKRMTADPHVAGIELNCASSELNDPIDQEHRFEEQVVETPGEVDIDYVTALEFGTLPAGGIGIDRLCMLLTGSTSIRDAVLLPLLRRIDPNANLAAKLADGDDPTPGDPAIGATKPQ